MSNMLAPSGIVDYVEHSALDKVALPQARLWVMAIIGGMFISLGGLLALVVAGGSPGLAASNPGLQKFVFGAVFPMGFIAVVLTGVDLFTSNCATQMVPLQRARIDLATVARVWSVSYLGNFVGALLTAWAFAYMTGIFKPGEPATNFLLNVAHHKLENPFITTFFKGMLANILVCVAAWQAYSAKDTLGRMMAIWLPVMAFVALGMEHSIANMFFIPAAMLMGLDASFGDFLLHNLLPATLGNIVGGALVIGLPYAWIYQPSGDQH
ncbi:formate/nitrite transporter family protein [Chitinibacter tainanensis]|uniref:formate/nitrite transporter family protein n=1 Tax=Chitinibacter tainanensis TaxID=230667 RepID=UPI00041AC2CA|nr:formate/nitrite transporter family protein [Chitinibacter tainanensis]